MKLELDDLTVRQLKAIFELLKKQAGEDGPQRFLWGELVVSEPKPFRSSFVHDQGIRNGWVLLRNVPRSVISVGEKDLEKDLEIIPFLENREKVVTSLTMARRAVELGANLGQEDAEYLLGHPEEIPWRFRCYTLFFPGTIWQRTSGREDVPVLWYDSRWILDFTWGAGPDSNRPPRFLRRANNS